MKTKTFLVKWSKNRTVVIITLIFIYPFGVYLMWKGEHFNRDLRWMITLFLFISSLVLGKYSISDTNTSDCSKTLYANGCTYYRDSQCQVIKQSCDKN